MWKGLSGERIKLSATINNSLTLSLNYCNTKIWVKVDESWLNQEKTAFTHEK